MVKEPYDCGDPMPMCEMMCPLMWRTAKADVNDQINIPPQTETVHWINFSPVEEHFYRQHHARCHKKLLEGLSLHPNLNVGLKTLPVNVLDRILQPLTQLRQACCHPQAVTGNSSDDADDNDNEDQTFTMQGLLAKLIENCKNDCETSLHVIMKSLNGNHFYKYLL